MVRTTYKVRFLRGSIAKRGLRFDSVVEPKVYMDRLLGVRTARYAVIGGGSKAVAPDRRSLRGCIAGRS